MGARGDGPVFERFLGSSSDTSPFSSGSIGSGHSWNDFALNGFLSQ